MDTATLEATSNTESERIENFQDSRNSEQPEFHPLQNGLTEFSKYQLLGKIGKVLNAIKENRPVEADQEARKLYGLVMNMEWQEIPEEHRLQS